MINTMDLTVTIVSDDDQRATVAHVLDNDLRQVVSSGVAVRRVGDEPEIEIGEALAVGRALVKYGNELIAAGMIMSDTI